MRSRLVSAGVNGFKPGIVIRVRIIRMLLLLMVMTNKITSDTDCIKWK